MIKLRTPNWEISNIDTVLFDKDGTFIDLHYFWGKMTELRALETIKFYNLENVMFSQICNYLGFDLNTKKMFSDGITALYSRNKIIEIFTQNLNDIGICAKEIEIESIFDLVSVEFYKNIKDYTKPISEAIDFIKKLRLQGLKIGIVTSDSVESTNLTIQQFGWEDLFDVVVGRETLNETKESGKPTKYALKKIGANPCNTVMIGDAPMDYISAKNAGIDSTILVATGQLGVNELKMHSAFVLKSLGDVECLKI